ncbi:PhzF family phenazine biosynthesis protein [Paractinoplanes lichenicola]|uniref:PhzF family phenazine biosynthesis protein n=1 Tax=Paractinoplanes lichenicola TaxID=2802976 RepID=A0ABS1VJT9_9ACTN|nr:PhzF family phenazine biosynthesis protein [Actinoplanes lichenicola]MBL7254022.1 PhzF family phenazine biosynthesis protein [Actinoplanes lichenicola]
MFKRVRFQGVPTDVAVVHSCRRDGRGGSPTAVVCRSDAPSDLSSLSHLPARAGASHAVVVDGPPEGPVTLRFFTATGELPACGHGTVAALAFLAARAGKRDHTVPLRIGSRSLTGYVTDGTMATFLESRIVLRLPTDPELAGVLPALGLPGLPVGVLAASTGRWRLLVPINSRAALTRLTPDPGHLREVCDRLNLLGCYVHSPPDAEGRLAARMFAPAIGIPEDVANANSTACLAAALAGRTIAVDMGDTVGAPSTILASARPGGAVEVGGEATITGKLRLD